jgi:Na+/H+-dicarboxylate symporter
MTTRQPLYKSLYFQVIVAIVIGILLGHFYPQTGVELKPLGDGFIKLIKMVIAPIIFCTVVSGIAGMQSMKSVGKTGGYALLYFEVVSSIALLIGLFVVNVVQPGRRHAHRRGHPGRFENRGLCHGRCEPEHRWLPAQRDPEHHRRRIRQR